MLMQFKAWDDNNENIILNEKDFAELAKTGFKQGSKISSTELNTILKENSSLSVAFMEYIASLNNKDFNTEINNYITKHLAEYTNKNELFQQAILNFLTKNLVKSSIQFISMPRKEFENDINNLTQGQLYFFEQEKEYALCDNNSLINIFNSAISLRTKIYLQDRKDLDLIKLNEILYDRKKNTPMAILLFSPGGDPESFSYIYNKDYTIYNYLNGGDGGNMQYMYLSEEEADLVSHFNLSITRSNSTISLFNFANENITSISATTPSKEISGGSGGGGGGWWSGFGDSSVSLSLGSTQGRSGTYGGGGGGAGARGRIASWIVGGDSKGFKFSDEFSIGGGGGGSGCGMPKEENSVQQYSTGYFGGNGATLGVSGKNQQQTIPINLFNNIEKKYLIQLPDTQLEIKGQCGTPQDPSKDSVECGYPVVIEAPYGGGGGGGFCANGGNGGATYRTSKNWEPYIYGGGGGGGGGFGINAKGGNGADGTYNYTGGGGGGGGFGAPGGDACYQTGGGGGGYGLSGQGGGKYSLPGIAAGGCYRGEDFRELKFIQGGPGICIIYYFA